MCVPELSLVLPMYNVRQYVEDCLASIYAQPEVERVEVILVDDGSPDDSSALAEAWLKAHTELENWRIIRQENLGLGGARNTGLAACRAPYVWFIDTDDEIAPGALAVVFRELTERPDILAFCARDRSTGELQIMRTRKIMTGEDFLLEPYEKRQTFYMTAWSHIWNIPFLLKNSLLYQEHLLHEDSEFTPRAIYFAEKLCEIPDVLYLIRPNPESITRKPNPQRPFHLLRVCESLFKFANDVVVSEEIRDNLYKEIGEMMQRSLILTSSMEADLKNYFIRNLEGSDKRLIDTIATLGPRQKKVALLFKILPYKLAIFVYVDIFHKWFNRT